MDPLKHRELLATFKLAHEWVKTENGAAMFGGARAGRKRACYDSIVMQAKQQGLQIGVPFPPGCLVRMIKYSTQKADSTGWDKSAIDRLQPTKRCGKGCRLGIGLITDDTMDVIYRAHHQFTAKRNQGYGVMELWGPCTLTREQLQRALEAKLNGASRDEMLVALDRLK